tara:strand:- start:241 stop:579 length:339 start_codon:yes stop_codon:yes gene_type:complete
MSIKLCLLKSGETIIAETLEYSDGGIKPVTYVVEHPHLVNIKEVRTPDQKEGDFGIDVTLSPWIILTSDTEMVLPVDWVVTIVEPMASLKQMYVDKSKTFKVTTEEEKEDGN